MKRSEVKKQFEKTIRASRCNQQEKLKFDSMLLQFYGNVHYSDRDKDEIIDPLDYGRGGISFEEFDEIMIEINEKEIEI